MNKIMILYFRPSFIKSEEFKSLFTSFHPAVEKNCIVVPQKLWKTVLHPYLDFSSIFPTIQPK